MEERRKHEKGQYGAVFCHKMGTGTLVSILALISRKFINRVFSISCVYIYFVQLVTETDTLNSFSRCNKFIEVGGILKNRLLYILFELL